MAQFDNVTIVKEGNVYFEGKVTSRTVKFQDGTKKTLGIALPGEYEFGTDTKEVMEILAGTLEVKLPGEDNFTSLTAPAEFTVPSKSKFTMRVHSVVDYCCSYID